MEPQESAIQLRAKLEVQRDDGHVLLAYYNPAGEISAADANARWWLPAHSLDNLPATMHGDWERQTIDGVLASETERTN